VQSPKDNLRPTLLRLVSAGQNFTYLSNIQREEFSRVDTFTITQS
jgi:hypothetical protein